MLFLMQHKMSSLSGMAQKIIINTLDQIVQQGKARQHVWKNLGFLTLGHLQAQVLLLELDNLIKIFNFCGVIGSESMG